MIFSETIQSRILSLPADASGPNPSAFVVAPAGSADGQVLSPRGVAALPDQPGGDNTDTVYVAEHGNSRISVFINSPPDTTPPGAPTLTSPADTSSTNDNTPTLDWSNVIDPSTPVTYELLVDDNSDFATPVISQNSLTVSIYTPPFASPLADGLYYWKVRAKDGVPNVGPFSSTSTFTVDTSTPPPAADCIDRSGISAAHTFITKWGSSIANGGQFDGISDIAIDQDCNVYVTQLAGGLPVDRVLKFSSDGTFITSWGPPGPNDGQFGNLGPAGIAIDPTTGDVYVADYGNNRIQKFTSDGAFITKWGQSGSDPDDFFGPMGVGVDSQGNVYVSNGQDTKIQKFTSEGAFITHWGGNIAGGSDLAIDLSNNDVYVTHNSKVHKFTNNGGVITNWGSAGPNDGQFTWTGPEYTVHGIGVVQSTGDVYVSDQGRVQMFDSDGNFLTKFGTVGSGNGQLNGPGNGIAVDKNDNVYVADAGNSRIQAFTGSEELVNQPPVAIGQTVTTNEDTPKPMKLNATDPENNALTFSIESNPIEGGTLTGFNPSTGDVTYNPPLNYNSEVTASDQFEFRVNDGTSNSGLATTTVVVDPVNDAPIARDDRFSMTQDSLDNLVVGSNDTDVDLDTLCFDSATDPPHGSAQVHPASTCGVVIITYTPDPGFAGIDTFNYTITDGEIPPLTDSAQVTINVTDTSPPTAPNLLYPVAIAINDNTPAFDWTDVNDTSPVTYSLAVSDGSGDVISETSIPDSTFTPASFLSDGSYFWRVWAVDSFGNIGGNNVTNFAIDTVEPAAPTITSPANQSSTLNNWVNLEGTAQSPGSPGADGFSDFTTVRVFDNVSGPLGTVLLDGSTFENWSFNATNLADGVHSFTVTVTEGANNTSPSSAATILTVDVTAPAVVITNPSSNATEVSPDTNVTATFDEAIDPATVTVSTFTLIADSGPIVTSVVSIAPDGQTAVLNPDSNLTGSTPYTATIKGGSGGVKDIAGNPLAGDNDWSFTTGSSDTIAPTITITDPTPSQTGVSITPCVCISFGENMSGSTINTGTIALYDVSANTSVAGQVSYDPVNNVASFNPLSPLAYTTEYTANVKGGASGVKDAAGNPLAADYSFSFTTFEQPTDNGNHSFIGRWGSEGAGNGQFSILTGEELILLAICT